MKIKSIFYLTLFIITIPLFVQTKIKKYEAWNIYLDPQSFEKSIQIDNQLLVKLCAIETKECARLHATLIKLAYFVEVVKKANHITIGALDCVKHWQFCSAKNMTSYPKLMLIEQQGKLYRSIDYQHIDVPDLLEMLQLPNLRAAREQLWCPRQQVLSISLEEFATLVPQGVFFIKFFRRSCIHCRKIVRMWKSLAFRMNSNIGMVCISEFDCEISEKNFMQCNTLGVKKVPALVWFEFGRWVRKYNGERTSRACEKFAYEMIKYNGTYVAGATHSRFPMELFLVLFFSCVPAL